MLKQLLAATALLSASLAATAADGDPFYGYAYDLASGKYLYTEVHQPKFEGGREVSSTIRYYAADGSLLGKKTLDYSKDANVPTFRFDLVKEGYAEAILSNAGPIVMTKVEGPGKPEKRKSVPKSGLMAADSGFHHLLQSMFTRLMAGEKIPFQFAVAGQLDSYKFSIQKVGEGSFEGKPAVKLLVQANSLLKYLAPDLNLLYDPTNKRLLEYKGVSNVHDPVNGKAYNARIAYYSNTPADAPKNLPPLK